jgi:hypothetical protein
VELRVDRLARDVGLHLHGNVTWKNGQQKTFLKKYKNTTKNNEIVLLPGFKDAF